MSDAKLIPLKVTPNSEGKLIATLYGKQFDVTGQKQLVAFGETYKVVKVKQEPEVIDGIDESELLDMGVSQEEIDAQASDTPEDEPRE